MAFSELVTVTSTDLSKEARDILVNVSRKGLGFDVKFDIFTWSWVQEAVQEKIQLDAEVRRLSEALSTSPSIPDKLPVRVVLAAGGWTPTGDGPNTPGPTNTSEVLTGYGGGAGDSWRLVDRLKLPGRRTGRAWFRLEVTTGSVLWCLGGWTGTQAVKVVHRYDATSGNWRRMPDMSQKRAFLTTAVVDCNIYAIGGLQKNGEDVWLLRSAEVYDPVRSEWRDIRPLQGYRAGHTTVTYEGVIYVFGGWNGVYNLNFVEKYDPEEGSWTFAGTTRTARMGACAVRVGNKVYMFGGVMDKQGEEGEESDEDH